MHPAPARTFLKVGTFSTKVKDEEPDESSSNLSAGCPRAHPGVCLRSVMCRVRILSIKEGDPLPLVSTGAKYKPRCWTHVTYVLLYRDDFALSEQKQRLFLCRCCFIGDGC